MRLEHEDDSSNIGAGGWNIIRGSNNVALRNTNVQELPGGNGDADTSFFVIGSEDVDTLEIDSDKLAGTIELVLPVQALPWRDLQLINDFGQLRHHYGVKGTKDPLFNIKKVLRGRNVGLYTGFEGVKELRIADGAAHLIGDAENLMVLPFLPIEFGTKVPVRLRVRGAQIGRDSGFVHVRQRSGGKIIGGVSLELVRRLRRSKQVKTYLENGKLVIR